MQPQDIIDQAYTQTLARLMADDAPAGDAAANERIVLAVQDTTSFNFSHHPATEGLGPLENEHCRGFLAHTTLAVSAAGAPIGILHQQRWMRSDGERGKAEQRHSLPLAAKESFKWVQGLPSTLQPSDTGTGTGTGTGAGIHWVTVCDREAHIYEFLATAQTQQIDFVVRAAQGRSITQEQQPLFDAVAALPVQATVTLALPRHPQRAPRDAQCQLRYATFTLKRPQRSQHALRCLTVQVVEMREVAPPAGESAAHWLLVTSLPVTSVTEAQTITQHYTRRWLIERLHYVLKSGCQLEQRQLESGAGLERLLALYTCVAMRVLQLTYLARVEPEASCELALQPTEWQVLYRHQHRSAQLPAQPPPLREAVRWIAQLGGFLARKSDGEPGVKVLWRGWVRLQDMVEDHHLFQALFLRDVGNA